MLGNCIELTQIAKKHFLGVPYIAISAHSYHIQQGWYLGGADSGGVRNLKRFNEAHNCGVLPTLMPSPLNFSTKEPSFVNSWNELLKHFASKSESLKPLSGNEQNRTDHCYPLVRCFNCAEPSLEKLGQPAGYKIEKG